MGTVFYLPGILGTELKYAVPPSVTYWVDEARLQANVVLDLMLDGTVGINPAAGSASLAPGLPLDTHYDRAINELKSDLKDTPFARVIPFGYDWRYSMVYSAGFLAAAIQREATPTNPCVLIGHSMGGLVARLAYYQLRTAGKGNLVKRIITIGTPHRGSARIINLLNGDFGEGFGYIFQSSILKSLPLVNAVANAYQRRILSVCGSWPGLIELLPMIENDGSEADKDRKRAFLPESYSGGGTLYKALFDNARDATHPILRDGVSIPPGKKLVCIVGKGYPTPYVTDPLPNPFPAFVNTAGLPLSIAGDAFGDGTVTMESAYVPGSELWIINCAHYEMPAYLAGVGTLKDLILEVIDEGNVTPPPPQTLPQVQAPVFLAPPLQAVPPPPPPPPPVRPLRGGRGRPVRRT